MSLPEHLAEPVRQWLDGYLKREGDPHRLEVERQLTAHLLNSGLLPAAWPCGCCELVGLRVVVVGDAWALHPVVRPARHLLH